MNFLDLKITKDANGDLHTSSITKTTDRNTILIADSFLPPWLNVSVRRNWKKCSRRVLEIQNERVSTKNYTLRAHKAKCLPREQLLASNEKQPQKSDHVQSCNSFKISGIERIENSIRGGDRLKKNFSKENHFGSIHWKPHVSQVWIEN